MLTALVLICSLAITPDLANCDRNSAVDVFLVPDPISNPASCLFLGQAYVAQTAMGRALRKDETVKIVCAPSRPPQSKPAQASPDQFTPGAREPVLGALRGPSFE